MPGALRHAHAGHRDWVIGTIAGVFALAALVAGSAFGTLHGHLDTKVISWVSAGVVLIAGALASTRLPRALGRLVGQRSMASAGGAVRIVTAAVGYLIVLFAVLAVLEVSVERLLVGAGLAGIVLGIAAQQSLGNVFAGVVLILARPFAIGDHIRVRSGALGGVFDAWVHDVSLTYVGLRTDDGILKVPNSAMLAAGVLRLPRVGVVPPIATPIATASAPGTAEPDRAGPSTPPNDPAHPAPVATPGAGPGTGGPAL